jgi:hypothetical protein
MKCLLILFLLMAAPLKGRAELVEVFQCETEAKRVSGSDDIDVLYLPMKKLGVMETGMDSFFKVVQSAAPKSWKEEPFYGPVVKLLVKDSGGRFFVVHFEYLRGHRTIGKGFRFVAIEAKAAPGRKDAWRGDPYQGSSIVGNGLMNKALQEIVEKL